MWLSKASPSVVPFLLLPTLFDLISCQATGTVSIADSPVLTTMRACVFNQVGNIIDKLGCNQIPPLNGCFCRTDLQSVAHSAITYYVNFWCTGGIAADTNSLVSIYNDYCSSANPVEAAVTQDSGAPITGGAETGQTATTRGAATVTQMAGTVTKAIYSTFTTILNDTTLEELYRSTHKSDGLETGYIVAIVVGVVALVIIIILLFMNKIRRRLFGYQGPYPSGDSLLPMGGIEGSSGKTGGIYVG
ncbi:hypothetical protein ABW20_dc0105465 [Dactylellina cionopaga]|nr:hypothetical protein ABW20_dc0105465 [Dactylellina cionopaga]